MAGLKVEPPSHWKLKKNYIWFWGYLTSCKSLIIHSFFPMFSNALFFLHSLSELDWYITVYIYVTEYRASVTSLSLHWVMQRIKWNKGTSKLLFFKCTNTPQEIEQLEFNLLFACCSLRKPDSYQFPDESDECYHILYL